MKYLLKLSFLIYIISHLVQEGRTGYGEVSVLLLITAVNILKDRYINTKYLTFLSLALILTGAYFEKSFAILISISVFDLVYESLYIFAIAAFLILLYLLLPDPDLPLYLLATFICAITAFAFRNLESKSIKYKESLDEERRLRYQLEQAKIKLLNSAKEASRLTEINERNRIAREIHDSVGHKIAGILIQLQAALKLQKSDMDKSGDILANSVEALSDSLTLLRDTVHRLKPKESVSVDYIRQIIENFKFCPVEISFKGDFNSVTVPQIELLATNIKEALTNASKHSGASKMEIRLSINDKLIRLLIQDNGRGCNRIYEGLGLSGMKERVANAGGSISISGDDGFMIVCIIPRNEGVNLNESVNS